jgi:hypothetical protein
MVTVKATGDLQITEITIAPEAIDPDDPEMLSDMVLAAVNEALRSAQRSPSRSSVGWPGSATSAGWAYPGSRRSAGAPAHSIRSASRSPRLARSSTSRTRVDAAHWDRTAS